MTDDVHDGEILPAEGGAVQFPPDEAGAERIVNEIAARARAHVADVSTDSGRKAVASVAYQVARSKSALDAAGRRMVEDAKREVARVDRVRKLIRDRLDVVRDEVRAPLTEWEKAEASRLFDLRVRLNALKGAAGVASKTAAEAERRLSEVEAIDTSPDGFAEFSPLAQAAQLEALRHLRRELSDLRRREAEAVELERLRIEAEARKAADAAAAQAAEAERKAREKAEADAAARVAAAEEAARAAEARALAAERAATEAAERAKRDAAEARARAERDAAEAAERAKRDAAEREAAAARRDASVAEVQAAIQAGLAAPPKQRAETITQMIVEGRIPHVRFEG